MSYMALYRKFRPQEFSEVRGQDHIVTTLKNELKAGRIGHAYLFTGTRGTGKTTMAKLFAKAVNCENPREDGSPCGECELCKSIASNSSLNVVELDAASNNHVEDIRGIIEDVSYPPTQGKYKVYIIDEVHMLTAAAFNAFLKTLEEPPSYVIFILATTELHKIPVTILSRCQRYDFRRITVSVIAERLRELLDAEGIEAESSAVNFIARAADGSMRDGISLLDQCIAFYLGQKLTHENVLKVLGAVDLDTFSHITRAVADENAAKVIDEVSDVVDQGRDLSQFSADLTWYFRNLLLINTDPSMAETMDVTAESRELMKEEAKMFTGAVLMRNIRVLSELTNQIRMASQPRVTLEVGLLRLTKPQTENDVESLEGRVINMERKLERGIITTAPASAPSGTWKEGPPPETEEKIPLPDVIPEEVEAIIERWRDIPGMLGGPAAEYIKTAFPTMVEGIPELILKFDDTGGRGDPLGYAEFGEDGHNHEALQNVLDELAGAHVPFKVELNTKPETAKNVYGNLFERIKQNAALAGIPVEEED
ncbi:MAG: DNA polymerase III subunit gamma/tau [Lachnospiraceae bacterium]|nr:DNA polymerase III subunit gamma/tau [Lachnospiraceae bacterium]